MPRGTWLEMEEKKNNPKGKIQTKLDGVVENVKGPREFTREGVLHAVTQFITCDDQVSFAKHIKKCY